MTVGFLGKRAAVAAAVLAVIAVAVERFGVIAAAGVVVGTFLAVYRVRLFKIFLDNALGSAGSTAKSVIYQTFSLMTLLLALIVSVILDIKLFFGMTAGLLTVPLVIAINAFTEKLGVTRNNWGMGEEVIVWKK